LEWGLNDDVINKMAARRITAKQSLQQGIGEHIAQNLLF
jgi:hypothetical protein